VTTKATAPAQADVERLVVARRLDTLTAAAAAVVLKFEAIYPAATLALGDTAEFATLASAIRELRRAL